MNIICLYIIFQYNDIVLIIYPVILNIIEKYFKHTFLYEYLVGICGVTNVN